MTVILNTILSARREMNVSRVRNSLQRVWNQQDTKKNIANQTTKWSFSTTTTTSLDFYNQQPLNSTQTGSYRSTTVGASRRYQCVGSVEKRFFSSYPSHALVGLPSLSPTMESGSIASWNVKVGDKFGPGDSLCSIETDKATVDFEAQDEGVVAKILVSAGTDEIKVGNPILITVEDESDVAAFANYTLADATKGTGSAPTPPPPAAAATPPPPPPVSVSTSAPTTPVSTGSQRIVASPKAHMLAKEKGFNIQSIMGTGPDGRILAADVLEYVPSASIPVATSNTASAANVSAAVAPAQATIATAKPVAGVGYTDYPLSESAKEVAARLTQSKRNVPHYNLTVDICVDELLKLRSTINGSSSGSTIDIGVYELLIKAAAMSMKTVPSVNASWMDSVVRVYDSVDINIVVGSGDSLYTPLLQDCSSKGLKAISTELQSALAVVDSTSTTESMSPSNIGTFTIMNLGMYGIKSCAPIIREPQSCSLAIGSIENRIVPSDVPDELYKESLMLTATISCDHRVVDGAVGAQWLAAFKSHIENPLTLLL